MTSISMILAVQISSENSLTYLKYLFETSPVTKDLPSCKHVTDI